MASASLLQMLAQGAPVGEIFNQYQQGQERGLKLADILGQQQARQFIPGAMQGDQNALAQLLGLNPEIGMQVSSNLERRADRKEDRAWRQDEAGRAQKNADRAYQLDLQQFGAARADANWQRRMKEAELALKDPDLVELYDDASGQPYKARYNPQTGKYDRVGGIKAPSGTSLEVAPDGTVSFTQGMGKITEGQGKDISYLNRILTAAPILDKNDEALTSFGESVAGQAPLGLGNYAKSSEYQQAEQAGRNFLTALLRKESGAQIPPSEERSYGDIFLPRPGDKNEVIAQKREARRQAAIGIRMGLPAPLIKGMVVQGVDFSTLDPSAPPNAAAGGSKSDNQAPRRRKFNPATGELE